MRNDVFINRYFHAGFTGDEIVHAWIQGGSGVLVSKKYNRKSRPKFLSFDVVDLNSRS